MAEIKIPQSKAEMRDLILEVVKTPAALLEEKDPYLKKHSERVANSCANFCEQFKLLGAEDVETVFCAGLLHDIGMVAVPLDILKQSDPFGKEEMVRIKRHSVSAERILSNFSYLNDLLLMVRHHHEAVGAPESAFKPAKSQICKRLKGTGEATDLQKIDTKLTNVAFEGSTGFSLGTLRFKLTTIASARDIILKVLTLFVKIASFQGLAGGTDKGVGFSIMGERFLVKDTLFRAGTVLGFFQRCEMGLDAAGEGTV